MIFTGFADEAGALLSTQIRATQELGWRHIEMRNVAVDAGSSANFQEGALSAVKGANIHDIPDADFERVCAMLQDAGISVNCFGSALANGSKSIETPFDDEWEEAKRAATRMQRMGTKLIRVMSYQPRKGEDQMIGERFRRLNEMQKLFSDAGCQMVHENCSGFGGQSAENCLRLLDAVPGLKLVFDTGNPTGEADMSKPVGPDGKRPRQSAWDFYSQVKPFIAYVHLKDGIYDAQTGGHRYVMAGDGEGHVRRIVGDLLQNGYDGGFSIEPHLPATRENQPDLSQGEARYLNYVDYGRRVMKIVEEVQPR